MKFQYAKWQTRMSSKASLHPARRLSGNSVVRDHRSTDLRSRFLWRCQARAWVRLTLGWSGPVVPQRQFLLHGAMASFPDCNVLAPEWAWPTPIPRAASRFLDGLSAAAMSFKSFTTAMLGPGVRSGRSRHLRRPPYLAGPRRLNATTAPRSLPGLNLREAHDRGVRNLYRAPGRSQVKSMT
jgi:hypothetical protein